MSDSTRARINTAFDQELDGAPVPEGLRALSVRAAVTARRERAPQPVLLALVAAVLMVALVATLVIGSHALRSNPTPARTRPAPSVVPPSPRDGAAMVYDQVHGELVLFGGTDVNGKTVNETWTWDGKAWRQYNLKVAPSARQVIAAAYDESHEDVVVFGGFPNLDDTWTWDGSAWKPRHPAHVPPISTDWPATMGYDPASKAVLLYGFEKITSGDQTAMTAETWSWNGADWTRSATSGGPIVPGAIVETGSRLYLIAQAPGRVGGRYTEQSWVWDSRTWTYLSDFLAPSGGSFAFDRERNTFVAFDGDTWTGDGTRWTRQHPVTQPPASGYMAYFAPLHEVVMWGSYAGNTSNDMWAWDGTSWNQVAAGTMPALPVPSGQFSRLTPAAAATLIRQTVKTASPVLLPTSVPAGMEARGVATPDSFDVAYRTDQRDETIELTIGLAQPPPGDQHSSDTRVPFRHSLAQKYGLPGQAEYFVYDPSSPRSDRWLIWTEPGQVSSQIGGPGVPYFLFASGLTDAEFWQVANSLR